MRIAAIFPFFFFNDTATTEIYTLSLHDALPISYAVVGLGAAAYSPAKYGILTELLPASQLVKADRKSTRLNSSHLVISYAVFCLKKKKCSRRRSLRKNCSTTARSPSTEASRHES